MFDQALEDITMYATRGTQTVTLPSHTPATATLSLTTSPSSSTFLSYISSTITVTSTSNTDINIYTITVTLSDGGISSYFNFKLNMIADPFPYFKCSPEAIIIVDNTLGAPIQTYKIPDVVTYPGTTAQVSSASLVGVLPNFVTFTELTQTF